MKVHDKVKVHNTMGSTDDKIGTILGVASEFPNVKFYIVGFDTPLENGDMAAVIVQSCLKIYNKD